MKIKVLFFATLKERAGTKQIELEVVDGLRVAELKQRLAEEFPILTDLMPTALVSVNREFAFDADVLPKDAEVALFPPVSGG